MHGSGRYYVDPLLSAGRLPNVATIVREGYQRYVVSELPLAAGAWVTMLTGQSIGEHGVFDYLDLDARYYDGMAGRRASSSTYAHRTIQSVMSAAGKRVASIYLPMTSPPWPINGVMISGFPLPDERHPPTYPPELASSLPAFAEDKLLTLQYRQRERIENYLRFNLHQIDEVTQSIWRDGYDVLLTCIPTPDLAHHYFWQPNDPEALEQIYRYYDQVDQTIGRLIAAAGDATIVVMSDHGGRAAPERLFGVNAWLAATGYLKRSHSLFARDASISMANAAVNLGKRLRVNHMLAGAIRGRLRRRITSVTHNTAFVDWSRTRAYGLDFICPLTGVEINLKNRQQEGHVSSHDYEPLRDELIERMAALEDALTGKRVFTSVHRREDLFRGDHVDRVPDIIGVLTEDYDVKTQLDLPTVGPNAGQWDYPFMGYHGQDAFFAVRGAGVSPGSSATLGRMVDIAPTLLHLAGVDIPVWMEGRLLHA